MIYFLRFKDLPERPSCAFYQRVRFLSDQYDLTILMRRGAHVAPGLADRASVRRCPWGFSSDNWASLDLGIYALWVFLTLLRAPRPKAVYTFHSFEAPLGAVAHLFRMRWVVDMLDLPEAVYLVGGRGADGHLAVPLLHLFVGVMRRIVRSADLVIAVGVGLEVGLPPRLLGDYGVPADRLLPVPNGVDDNLLQLAIERPEDGAFRLFYVGAVAANRGIKEMLDAFTLVHQQVPEAQLVVAGPVHRHFASHLPELLSRCAAARAAIVLLGEINHDEVLEWIRRSDVCLYPFLSAPGLDEVIPIKVLEYLALGRPVVASDLPGVRLLVSHLGNGLLVPPGDPVSMAHAVLRLHADVELRDRLGGAGRLTAEGLTWKEIHRQLGERLPTALLQGIG